jgi:hypothetical protein
LRLLKVKKLPKLMAKIDWPVQMNKMKMKKTVVMTLKIQLLQMD